MSGLLALLDDVAAIAKVAAASVDDIAAAAGKAGAKAAGVVIDDAAVAPKYVHGFSADRELPMIARIAAGSVKNKLVVLLPGLLALNYVLPVAITPMLMLGGAYLCFEGAEKIFHSTFPDVDPEVEKDFETGDPAHLEEEKVAGAIKTDFILSAEIMTITLAAVESPSLWVQAVTLALVGVFITLVVYGAVAVIVKMDDVGLHLAATRKTALVRGFGRALVTAMPQLMAALAVIGTVAMLWVGGSILLHGFEVTNIWAGPYEAIHHLAERTAAAIPVPAVHGVISWALKAEIYAVFGLGVGLGLIPVVTRLIAPLWARLSAKVLP